MKCPWWPPYTCNTHHVKGVKKQKWTNNILRDYWILLQHAWEKRERPVALVVSQGWLSVRIKRGICLRCTLMDFLPPTNTRYITKNTKQIIPSMPSQRPSSQIPSSSLPVGQSERSATLLCAVESLTRGVIGDLIWDGEMGDDKRSEMGKVYISIYLHSGKFCKGKLFKD